ncbi:MAG TPA: hypothetical protein PLS53_00635 [Thermoanaerobaculaceae bacterium]|nr:hypothetical protein [Thermoanaerobaculaceae bacterium]HPS76641.1 hypothetical protein [Thermoanaerobaculaceae bacterium]
MRPKCPRVAVLILILVAIGSGRSSAQEASDPDISLVQLGSGFTYQGVLRDAGGVPVTATCGFRFSLWDSLGNPTGKLGGDSLVASVSVIDGYFVAVVNAGGEFGSSAFVGDARWLQVEAKCGAEPSYTLLSPRQAMTTAPYAQGLLPGAKVLGAVAGSPALTVTNTSTTGYGLQGSSSATSDARGVYGIASAGTGTGHGVYGTSFSPDGRGVYGTALTYGVYGRSTAASGTTYGVYGTASSPDGRGVYGSAPARGAMGTASGAAGAGVYGEATGASSDGVYGVSSGGSGRGVKGESTGPGSGSGVLGISTSPTGQGVSGSATSTSGDNAGVSGVTSSSTGRGVEGSATATTGRAYGVWGETASSDTMASGVYGSAPTGAAKGVFGSASSTGGVGVWGYAGASSGFNLGVFGTSNSPDGYGARFTNQAGGVALDLQAGMGTNVLTITGDASDIKFRVTKGGEVYADGTFHPGGADFAELLPAAAGLEPGDVLCLDAGGQLERCTAAFQPTVAGVYSTRPGVVGGSSEATSSIGSVPLAIVGVVPVKVSAEAGAIRPGDLLTAAATAGQAMRAGSDPPRGTVIGKALQEWTQGSGVIRALVMLQ